MPPRSRTTSWMRRSLVRARSRCRSGWTARPAARRACAAVQAASTLAALSWKRSAAVVGTSTGTAVGRADEVAVAGVARVGHQDLVAGFDQRQAGQLQRGRGAGRDDDAARRHVDAEALRIPAADALAQRGRGRWRACTACAPSRMARAAASCTSGGAVKSGSPMFRKIIGRSVCATSRASCEAALAHLHHVEGLDALGALRDPHRPRLAAWRGRPRPRLARSCGARPLSTAFTYLWPSVPPNSLASSMHSLSTTRQGTSRQCWNS